MVGMSAVMSVRIVWLCVFVVIVWSLLCCVGVDVTNAVCCCCQEQGRCRCGGGGGVFVVGGCCELPVGVLVGRVCVACIIRAVCGVRVYAVCVFGCGACCVSCVCVLRMWCAC